MHLCWHDLTTWAGHVVAGIKSVPLCRTSRWWSSRRRLSLCAGQCQKCLRSFQCWCRPALFTSSVHVYRHVSRHVYGHAHTHIRTLVVVHFLAQSSYKRMHACLYTCLYACLHICICSCHGTIEHVLATCPVLRFLMDEKKISSNLVAPITIS